MMGAACRFCRGKQNQLTTTPSLCPLLPPVCLSCSEPVVRKSCYSIQDQDLGHWFSGWQPWKLKSIVVRMNMDELLSVSSALIGIHPLACTKSG